MHIRTQPLLSSTYFQFSFFFPLLPSNPSEKMRIKTPPVNINKRAILTEMFCVNFLCYLFLWILRDYQFEYFKSILNNLLAF